MTIAMETEMSMTSVDEQFLVQNRTVKVVVSLSDSVLSFSFMFVLCVFIGGTVARH